MAVKRGGLGRGLDSLIPNKKAPAKSIKEKAEEKTPEKTSKARASEIKESKAGTKTKKVKAEAKPAVKPAAKATQKAAEKPASKATQKAAEKAAPVSESAEPIESVKAESSVVKENAAEETLQHTEKMPVRETAPSGGSGEMASDHVVMMKISQVEPNREQPRKEFDKEKLEELAESIRQYGVIQPLLVQKNDGYYEIIAGERRWRASKIAGLKEVPVIIRDYTEQEVVEISLIENIQREDLNPIEEANAYVRLMEEFHLTQENIAKRVSKSRAAVTNAIRLLRLPQEIREMLIYGDLTEGHARAILGLPDAENQLKAAHAVNKGGLSVRDTEKLVREMLNPKVPRKKETDPQSDLIYRDLEEQMKQVLGTKVAIRRKNKSAGKIEIDYYSAAELERLLDLLRSVSS